MRKTINNIFLGLCVLAVGIGYFGNYIDVLPWTDFTLFFPGWWALFFIIPPISMMILAGRLSWWGLTSILFGVSLMLNRLGIEPFAWSVGTAFAVLLILIGIRLIFSPLFRKNKFKWNGKAGRKWRPKRGKGHGGVSFGAKTISYEGEIFTGTDVSVSFGELTLDLRGADIQNSASVLASCSFGELNILVPNDPCIRVELQSNISFGEVHNTYPARDVTAPVTLNICVECSFGEVNIVG